MKQLNFKTNADEIKKKSLQKALPISVMDIETLSVFKCYLDGVHYRQLTTMMMFCDSLKEIDFSCVLKGNIKDIPRDFVDFFGMLPKSAAVVNLESIVLTNNYFGDHTLLVLIPHFLQLKKLKKLDISASDLTDEGINHFFQ
jgi:hypothetical protein